MEKTNKRWKVMKLCVLFSIIFTWNISADVFSQLIHFEKSGLNTTIKDVLKTIERQTEYTFFYNDAFLDLNRPFRVGQKTIEVGTLLNAIFEDTDLTYREHDNKFIVITPKVLAQNMAITGTVTDETGDPMPGVNILIKGSLTGNSTDQNGKYLINVTSEQAVLVFSYIGYESIEIPVQDRRVIDVVMKEATQMMDEVVVTALGIKREAKALSYSTSNVKGEELAEAHETNVANALSGKVAGVFVSRPASTASGASKVLIRGNNSLRTNSQPLYVVDGIPINNDSGGADQWGGFDYGDGISNINPNDIESMTVLKGPNATALYGQRGSNGVILITTKSGSQKKRIGINFSSDNSFGTGLILPDFQNVYGVGYNGEFTHFRGDDGVIYSMAAGQKGWYLRNAQRKRRPRQVDARKLGTQNGWTDLRRYVWACTKLLAATQYVRLL